MSDNDRILGLMERHNVPDYVSVGQIEEMIKIMGEDQIHPRHKGCDMTLEMAVGVNPMDAIMYHQSRGYKDPSIYKSLFNDFKKISLI